MVLCLSLELFMAVQTAIEAGEFREDPGDPGSSPSVAAVLSVAADIVAGMAFLHERKILHGDLTCSAHSLACQSFPSTGS